MTQTTPRPDAAPAMLTTPTRDDGAVFPDWELDAIETLMARTGRRRGGPDPAIVIAPFTEDQVRRIITSHRALQAQLATANARAEALEGQVAHVYNLVTPPLWMPSTEDEVRSSMQEAYTYLRDLAATHEREQGVSDRKTLTLTQATHLARKAGEDAVRFRDEARGQEAADLTLESLRDYMDQRSREIDRALTDDDESRLGETTRILNTRRRLYDELVEAIDTGMLPS